MKPLDSKKRSRTFWVIVVVLLCVFYYLLACLDTLVVCFLWIRWNPGRTVSYWLLKTPLKSLADEVRTFFLYIPLLSLAFMAGMVITFLFQRCWLRLALMFALILTLANRIEFLIAWYGFYAASRLPLLFFIVITLSLFASPLAGSYLTAHFLIKKPLDPMICQKCGYLLYGLDTTRCPECGTGFDPRLLQPPTELPDTPAS